MGDARFLDSLNAQLDGADREQCERIAHSVLYHLWRRLPRDEREKMIDTMPEDVTKLLQEPESPNEPQMTEDQWERQGSIEYDYFEKFRGEIRRETELNEAEDEAAIAAVFGELKSALPAVEASHIQEMLPDKLKQTWAGS